MQPNIAPSRVARHSAACLRVISQFSAIRPNRADLVSFWRTGRIVADGLLFLFAAAGITLLPLFRLIVWLVLTSKEPSFYEFFRRRQKNIASFPKKNAFDSLPPLVLRGCTVMPWLRTPD